MTESALGSRKISLLSDESVAGVDNGGAEVSFAAAEKMTVSALWADSELRTMDAPAEGVAGEKNSKIDSFSC